MLIQIPRKDTIRVRFNPNKSRPEDFTSEQGRAIAMDTINELVETMERYTVECVENSDPGTERSVQLTTRSYGKGPFESQEPPYHSDPFFVEFNGVPSSDPHRTLDLQSTYGVFIDNLSQMRSWPACR